MLCPEFPPKEIPFWSLLGQCHSDYENFCLFPNRKLEQGAPLNGRSVVLIITPLWQCTLRWSIRYAFILLTLNCDHWATCQVPCFAFCCDQEWEGRILSGRFISHKSEIRRPTEPCLPRASAKWLKCKYHWAPPDTDNLRLGFVFSLAANAISESSFSRKIPNVDIRSLLQQESDSLDIPLTSSQVERCPPMSVWHRHISSLMHDSQHVGMNFLSINTYVNQIKFL